MRGYRLPEAGGPHHPARGAEGELGGFRYTAFGEVQGNEIAGGQRGLKRDPSLRSG